MSEYAFFLTDLIPVTLSLFRWNTLCNAERRGKEVFVTLDERQAPPHLLTFGAENNIIYLKSADN